MDRSEWKIVSEKTEKVIDTNPKVWLNAAKKALENKQYSEAISNSQQARQLSQSSDNNMRIELSAIDIVAYYGKGDITSATREKNRVPHSEWVEFFANEPRYLIFFREKQLSNWDKIWHDVVSLWISKRNYNKLEKNLPKIKDKILASLADNKFVFGVVENNKINLLQALFNGGYSLASCLDGKKNNLTMIAVKNEAGQTLDFLLQHRINNINHQNNTGMTALMYAAKIGIENSSFYYFNS